MNILPNEIQTGSGRRFARLAILLAIIGAVLFVLVHWDRSTSGEKAPEWSSHATIESVRSLAELAVLRMQVADVLMGEADGSRIAVLVRGDCDMVVDLARAREVQRNDEARTVRIALPQPIVRRPRVDHERTTIYKVERTTWLPWRDTRSELYKQAMTEAQSLVENACNNDGYKNRARTHANLLVVTFLDRLGWTATIEWDDDEPNP